jgi:hypothetical protein
MLKHTLIAASLATLLAGPATASDDPKRVKAIPAKPPAAAIHKQPAKAAPAAFTVRPDKDKRKDDWHDDRGDDDGDWRDHDLHDRDWNDHDRNDRDWRDDDRHHGHDWDRDDWRRDDDWRRRGWHYHGWRNDGWRYYRWHDNRHWRYVPPYRYSLDFGYRSGYELAWRDWLRYGLYDRHWRRSAFYGYGVGNSYRAGYDAGWRDAAYYYGRGYRPDYWSYDPQGGWFFGFRIDG